MKLVLVALLSLALAVPAFAGESGPAMLVIDPDPTGTNVRDSPGGKVVKVISRDNRSDAAIKMRLVIVTGQDKDWFQVRLADGASGWMHRSVLGSCASATEDGAPTLLLEPRDDARAVGKVKDGTPLNLLEVKGTWAKVETAGSSGKKNVGWLPEQCLFSNPYNDCRAKP